MAPENTVAVVRERDGGGRQPVTEIAAGRNDKVTVEKGENGGHVVVIAAQGAEADDAVLLRTQEVVRGAPSSDPEMAAHQLENEGGVHVGVDPDGEGPVEPEPEPEPEPKAAAKKS